MSPDWLNTPPIPWDPAVEPDAQAHQFVVHDLFPAQVCPQEAENLSDRALCWRGRLRAIVVTTEPSGTTPPEVTHVYFFVEVPEYPGIGLLHKAEVSAVSGGRHHPGGILLEFTDGQSVRLHPDKGCGCGSRLRSLRPFPRFSLVSL